MKIVFILILCGLAIWGGYYAATVYDRGPAPPSAGLEDRNPPVKRGDGDARNRQARIDQLKAEIERQTKLVADLDARLNRLDVGKGADDESRLRAEIENEKTVIAGLESRVANDRTSLAGGAKTLLAARRDGVTKKQAALADTQTQIRTIQEDIRVLREQLRNRVSLGWTMDQVTEANNRLGADQANLTALHTTLQQVRAADYSSSDQQAATNQALSELRTDMGQAQAALAGERKKLSELEDQIKRDDKSTNDAFSQRDRLQNQFQTEKQKLEAMKTRLEALTRESGGG